MMRISNISPALRITRNKTTGSTKLEFTTKLTCSGALNVPQKNKKIETWTASVKFLTPDKAN